MMNSQGYIIQDICPINPKVPLTLEALKQATNTLIENHHELWKELWGWQNYTSWIGDNITHKKAPEGYSMVLIHAKPCGMNILLLCEDTKSWTKEELFEKFDSWPNADVLEIKTAD